MAYYTLKEILKCKPSYGLNAKALNKGKYKYFTQSDIKNGFPRFFVNEHKNKFIKKEDFFISRAGTIKSYYHNLEDKWVYAGYLIKYPLNEKIVIPKYIYYLSKSSKVQKMIQNFSRTGSVMQKLNPPVALKLKFFIPSLKEQQKIINIIEPIEKFLKKINELKTKIANLIKHLPEKNFSFHLSETTIKLKNKKKNIDQVSAKILDKRDFFINYPFENKGTYKTNLSFCPEGTLLINTIRMYLEKFAILPQDSDVNGTLLQLKVKKEFISILHNLLNDNFWKQANLFSYGTKMPVLNKKVLMNRIKFTSVKNYLNDDEILRMIIKLNSLQIKLIKIKENIIYLLIK